MKEINEAGMIYVLTDGDGKYKIGFTKNLSRRIIPYRTHSPVRLEVLVNFMVDDVSYHERFLHLKFANERLHGEWFELDQEDVQFIWEYASQFESGYWID